MRKPRSQITDEPIASGEGITYTSAKAASLFPVRVVFTTGGRPMASTIRATSAEQALQFALARHPAADPSRTTVIDATPETRV